jgi:hypothetical protein
MVSWVPNEKIPNKEARKAGKTQILYSWFPGFLMRRFLIRSDNDKADD